MNDGQTADCHILTNVLIVELGMCKEVNFILIAATYVEGKDGNCSIKICCIITICLLTLHILSFTELITEPKSNATTEDRNDM